MDEITPASVAAQHAAALSLSLDKLIGESKLLRDDVNIAERTRRRENRLNLVLIGMLSLFVLCVLAVAWQNNRIAKQTADTNAHVVSCTVPGGKCYENAKTQQSGAVAAILRASTYMAECSRLHPGESGPAFDSFLEACVAAKLAAVLPPTPTPRP